MSADRVVHTVWAWDFPVHLTAEETDCDELHVCILGADDPPPTNDKPGPPL